MRQSYRRGFGECDVPHYLLIRYYPTTDGRIRQQLCVTQLTGLAGTQKHCLLGAGTLERFINTLYLITVVKEVQHTHCTYRRQRSHLTMSLLDYDDDDDDELWKDTLRLSQLRMDGSSWLVWASRRKRRRWRCQSVLLIYRIWSVTEQRLTSCWVSRVCSWPSTAEGNLWHMCLRVPTDTAVWGCSFICVYCWCWITFKHIFF